MGKLAYGEPEDVQGDCNAHLHIADNFGDNHATMRCQLPAGHAGLHQERYPTFDGDVVTVIWHKAHERDEEEEPCDGSD